LKIVNDIDLLLINSPLFREFPNKYDEDSLPPLGLGYIATYAQNLGLKAILIDSIAERISFKNLKSQINELAPKTIGFNIFSTNYQLVKELVEDLKFKTNIVIGGLSTKELYKEIFKWQTQNPIHIIAGDGELITSDIVKHNVAINPTEIFNNKFFYKIDKSSFYYVKDISVLKLDRTFFTKEPVVHPLGFKEVNIVTSRGCIFNCSFCAAAFSQNKEFGIRESSETSILSELEEIALSFPEVDSIRVLDDLFLKKSKHIEFASNIFSKTYFKWRSMAHVSTFNNVGYDVMNKLKASGCAEVFLGVESGSPRILKSINKTSDVNTIKNNIEKILKVGIGVKAYFIYGFPEETMQDAELTYQLAIDLHRLALKYGSNFRTSVFQYRPYHGTEIYHDLSNKGWDTNSIRNINPNIELSNLVDRLQFNFHSGNYSKIGIDDLHSYICKTAEINTTNLIEGLRRSNKSKEKQ
jgi:radical SAM superfamily enzyme YgiQ (UPF0313 family)